MSAKTPDPTSYQHYFRHLEGIDDAILDFCLQYGLRFAKNVLREPCRVLNKPGIPELWIDLHVEQNWETEQFPIELTHTIEVKLLYVLEDNTKLVKQWEVARGMPFTVLEGTLVSLLLQALAVGEACPLPTLTKDLSAAKREGWHRTRYAWR